MNNIFLRFLLFVLPLGVDTFALAGAVGASRLAGSARWRISAAFVVCEAGMPLVGIALGAAIGHAVGSVAGYLFGGLLIVFGGSLLAEALIHIGLVNTRCAIAVGILIPILGAITVGARRGGVLPAVTGPPATSPVVPSSTVGTTSAASYPSGRL